MSTRTGIEWTDATWNPIRGCTHVSEGCRNCYAEKVANRFCGPGSPYEGVVQIDAEGKGLGKWNGEIKFVEKRLLDPLRWKEPRRIFVNSMSDLFHPGVTDEMLDRIFAVMALCPQHTFQVLTKRPERMREYLTEAPGRLADVIESMRFDEPRRAVGPLPNLNGGERWFPLVNVWMGVSVEDQKMADARIPLLLQTPAAVRFISYESALGPIDLLARDYLELIAKPGWQGEKRYPFPGLSGEWRTKLLHLLDWVICGGESGPGARLDSGGLRRLGTAHSGRSGPSPVGCFPRLAVDRSWLLRQPPAQPSHGKAHLSQSTRRNRRADEEG